MRWRYCYYCGAEEESIREDDSDVIIFECHSCWEDYCDKCGSKNVRMCNVCLNKTNYRGSK